MNKQIRIRQIRNKEIRIEDTGNRRVVIDLSALAQNFRQLSKRIAPAECGAVVKANAYGLGAVEVAQALARKSGWRIQVSENTALNLLGLSTQVPVQATYLSDGPSKTYLIGKRELIFKKRILKESGFKHSESELVVQALKALGEKRITAEIRRKLHQAIPSSKWPKILRDARTAPAWVCDVIRTIAKEVPS